MEIIRLLTGISLLSLGQKLYWLFIAAIGFVTGMSVFPQILPQSDQNTILIVSLILAVIGAFLAIFLQKFALWIAGFFAGAYSLISLAKILQIELNDLNWVLFLAGGILGILLIGAIFNWALIILSSFVGSSLISHEIVQYFHLESIISILLVIVLFFSGIYIQSRMMEK